MSPTFKLIRLFSLRLVVYSYMHGLVRRDWFTSFAVLSGLAGLSVNLGVTGSAVNRVVLFLVPTSCDVDIAVFSIYSAV